MNKMNYLRIWIATAVLLGMSVSAQAMSLTWTFQNALFSDQTSLTGSFGYDADIGGAAGFSALNLQTANGAYTGNASWLSGPNFLATDAGSTYLAVKFADALTSAGGTVAISPSLLSNEGNLMTATIFGKEISIPLPRRWLVSGSVVSSIAGGTTVDLTEPAALLLFALGLGIVVNLTRRGKLR